MGSLPKGEWAVCRVPVTARLGRPLSLATRRGHLAGVAEQATFLRAPQVARRQRFATCPYLRLVGYLSELSCCICRNFATILAQCTYSERAVFPGRR